MTDFQPDVNTVIAVLKREIAELHVRAAQWEAAAVELANKLQPQEVHDDGEA